MERREQLLRQAREEPVGVVNRLLELEAEKSELEARKAELEAENAELKRQLFGAKADKLSAEQEQQMAEVLGDLAEQHQRPQPVSAEILEEEKPSRSPPRRLRHPLPAELETVTTVLEPTAAEKVCPRCGPKRCIGEERSQRLNLIPARLVREVTVRPKYACNCGQCGVAIAPLPATLIPQSRLGLGLAVFILLLRFDDHVAYYSLERMFRERHQMVIARQQMVQWVEQIALLLLGIYHAIWAEMKVGGYLQIDETPVKVLDPEVKGKAATGYLWFYSVAQGDVIVEFCSGRGQQGPKARLEGFQGRIQSDAYDCLFLCGAGSAWHPAPWLFGPQPQEILPGTEGGPTGRNLVDWPNTQTLPHRRPGAGTTIELGATTCLASGTQRQSPLADDAGQGPRT